MTIESMLEMTYGGNFELEHTNAIFHDLTDQEKFDIVAVSQIVGEGTENPWVATITHAFTMGKIAGIRQERAKKCKK